MTTTFMKSIDPAERIIVALDCDAKTALQLADALEGKARWFKVGMTLFYQEGPPIVAALKERGFKVFVDLKLHDIPHQVRGAAQSVVKCGADMLSIHAAGGRAMMEAACEGTLMDAPKDAIKEAPKEAPITLGITVLTSMDEETLASIGVANKTDDQVKCLALLAQEAGLTGVVASPLEARMLRELLGPEAAIVTPGVRPAGTNKGDQSRVATPEAAIRSGASHLVIGRPITAAADPSSAFDAIVSELDFLR